MNSLYPPKRKQMSSFFSKVHHYIALYRYRYS